MKRVLLLSYTFPPLSTGGTQSVINMCKYLPSSGWEVIALTASNPCGMDTDEATVSYLPDGLSVFRIPHGRSNPGKPSGFSSSGSRIPPILKEFGAYVRNYYVNIPDRLITWKREVLPLALKIINETPPHCIISRGPHHSLHLIARKISRISGIPYIPFFGDLWLADSNVSWPSRLNRLIESYLERITISSARGVIATTEGSTGYFINRYRDKCPPTFIAENAYDPDRMGEPAPPADPGEHLEMGLTGNFFGNQTPDQLIEGLELFYKRNSGSMIRIKIAGKIDDDSLKRISTESMKGKVKHIGRLAWDEVPAFQKSCDVLVGYLVDKPGSELKNSRKTAEYLISGRSVLGIVPPQGDMAERIRDYGNGYICPPRSEDIAIILERIEYQWQTTGHLNLPRSIDPIEKKFSARYAIPRLASFLDEMAAP
ncbi:MAG TPA: hypothetical protein PLM22_09815 [Candidatus Sabulitectum sp.]|nr:hypothetical protein [Candidatus Sabulitectum sp.]HPR21447.1 hypothetical protein [Candidatus Sabulitectum sp.]